MTKRFLTLPIVGLGLALLNSPAAHAQAVSANFIGSSYQDSSDNFYFNTDNNIDPASTTGAYPIINWNNDTGGNMADTITPLYDSNANDSGATFVANAASTNSNMLEENDPNYFSGPNGSMNPNYQLMDGYLQSSATMPVTVDIGNVPYANYSLYVYLFNGTSALDTYTFTPGSATNGIFVPSGVPTTIAAMSESSFDGTFKQATATGAGDYIVFQGLSAANFELASMAGSAGVPINGLQIVNMAAAPEPSGWAVLALGASALGLLVARRRKAGALA